MDDAARWLKEHRRDLVTRDPKAVRQRQRMQRAQRGRESRSAMQQDGPRKAPPTRLSFPTRELYDAYQDDAERRSLSAERGGIIIKTDIFVGAPGPTYGSLSDYGSTGVS